MVLVVKNQPAEAGDVRDAGSIPGWGRSPGGGHGHPLQYSYLENPMDRGAWWATVHRVTKSQTRPKQLRMHTRPMEENYCREEMQEMLARVWEQVGRWKVEQIGAQTQRKGSQLCGYLGRSILDRGSRRNSEEVGAAGAE